MCRRGSQVRFAVPRACAARDRDREKTVKPQLELAVNSFSTMRISTRRKALRYVVGCGQSLRATDGPSEWCVRRGWEEHGTADGTARQTARHTSRVYSVHSQSHVSRVTHARHKMVTSALAQANSWRAKSRTGTRLRLRQSLPFPRAMARSRSRRISEAWRARVEIVADSDASDE